MAFFFMALQWTSVFPLFAQCFAALVALRCMKREFSSNLNKVLGTAIAVVPWHTESPEP